jgi:hypothetical protein
MMTGDEDVFTWWFFLCAVSVLNILAWSLSAAYLRRRRPLLSPEAYATRRLVLLQRHDEGHLPHTLPAVDQPPAPLDLQF